MSSEDYRFLVDRILSLLDHKGASVDVNVIDDRSMRFLNKKFRGRNSSTNVLAFPYPEDFPQSSNDRYLGEVYLNPTYIKNHNESMEHMLIHGIMHLLGFDHARYDDRIKMEQVERKIIKDLNK